MIHFSVSNGIFSKSKAFSDDAGFGFSTLENWEILQKYCNSKRICNVSFIIFSPKSVAKKII